MKEESILDSDFNDGIWKALMFIISCFWLLKMKDRLKTKLIEKELRKNKKKTLPGDEEKKGEPELKSLSDFVTALTPVYASRPIYTGGRIVQAQGKLFASCNQDVAVYDLFTKSPLPKIKLVHDVLPRITKKLLISQSIPRAQK